MIPGIMVSQVWPGACDRIGATEHALTLSMEPGFFKTFQIVHVSSQEERHAISNLVQKSNSSLTYCLARILGRKRLNLSSLLYENRRKAIDEVKRGLEHGRECGASRISIVSGPAPGKPHLRNKALHRLVESLEEILLEVSQSPAVELVIEPLDIGCHKKGTLGTISETVGVISRFSNSQLKICADTAHMLLNNEDPVNAVRPYLDMVSEYHLCNPVLDERSGLFGDPHIPFGPPGPISEDDLPEMVACLSDTSLSTNQHQGLFLEILNRSPEDEDAAETLLRSNVRIMKAIFKEKD